MAAFWWPVWAGDTGSGVYAVSRVAATFQSPQVSGDEFRGDWKVAATEIFADPDYGGQRSMWADWAVWKEEETGPDQAAAPSTTSLLLVTTGYDGKLRLYQETAGTGTAGPGANEAGFGFRRVAIADTTPHGGREPFSCAVSPDGGRVAVGYTDSTRVDVFALALSPSPSLSHAYAPDTGGIGNGDISSVAWSRGFSDPLSVISDQSGVSGGVGFAASGGGTV